MLDGSYGELPRDDELAVLLLGEPQSLTAAQLADFPDAPRPEGFVGSPVVVEAQQGEASFTVVIEVALKVDTSHADDAPIRLYSQVPERAVISTRRVAYDPAT